MKRLAPLLTCVALMLLAADANAGPVIITEIMYNPASNEGNYREDKPVLVEWVEIHNTSDSSVDMTGWYLQDEDGPTGKFPKDTAIKADQTMVIVPAELEAAQFHAAWGDNVVLIRVTNWSGMQGLANSPSETNEILQLRNAQFKLEDQVNYDDEGDWPSDSPQGPSIYLLPGKFNDQDNDDGKNWARSEPDKHGGKHASATEIFDSKDVGSPGTVVIEE